MLPDYNYMPFHFMSSLSNINEASQKDSLLAKKAMLKVNMHLSFMYGLFKVFKARPYCINI